MFVQDLNLFLRNKTAPGYWSTPQTSYVRHKEAANADLQND